MGLIRTAVYADPDIATAVRHPSNRSSSNIAPALLPPEHACDRVIVERFAYSIRGKGLRPGHDLALFDMHSDARGVCESGGTCLKGSPKLRLPGRGDQETPGGVVLRTQTRRTHPHGQKTWSAHAPSLVGDTDDCRFPDPDQSLGWDFHRVFAVRHSQGTQTQAYTDVLTHDILTSERSGTLTVTFVSQFELDAASLPCTLLTQSICVRGAHGEATTSRRTRRHAGTFIMQLVQSYYLRGCALGLTLRTRLLRLLA
jgi:hypothetical protein